MVILGRIVLLFILIASPFLSGNPEAATDFGDLRETQSGLVINVVDPHTLLLKDGRTIALTGLDYPDFTPPESGDYAYAAQTILKDLLVGQNVRVYQSKSTKSGRINRMGHDFAHLVLANNGVWVQELILSLGLARVRPTLSHPEMVRAMLFAENMARVAQKGVWADEKFGLQTPDSIQSLGDGYHIVEGTIRSVATVKNTLYLNFGDRWQNDFTIAIAAGDRRYFTKSGIDLQQLGNRTVRARGWVRDYNGPYMEIERPEAMEIIGPELIQSE